MSGNPRLIVKILTDLAKDNRKREKRCRENGNSYCEHGYQNRAEAYENARELVIKDFGLQAEFPEGEKL